MQAFPLEIPVASAWRFRSSRTDAWLVAIFVALSAVLVLIGAGTVARGFVLLGSGLLGWRLSKSHPAMYVSFVLWLWFLTPFVRRLLDYRSGWVDTDPILAASLLATLACVPNILPKLLRKPIPGSLPFLLAFSAVIYGAIIGVFSVAPGKLLIETANWLAPLLFGFYVLVEYSDRDHKDALGDAFESTFRWGLLLMGFYGVAQFTLMPAWDALWMNQTDIAPFGIAEPFGVRVFSTMASPVPLGVASFTGLVLLMRQRGMLVTLANIAGYAALILCSVRSTWGLWAIATALVLFRNKAKFGRFLLVIAGAMILLFAATSIQPVRDVVQKRFDTLSDLKQDGSFQERKGAYEQLSQDVLLNPLGVGLGGIDALLKGDSEFGSRDSGILEIVLSLGFVAGGVYFFALGLVIWSGIKNAFQKTGFEIAAGAIGIAMVSHMMLSSISASFSGITLWSFAAISLASSQDRSQPEVVSENLLVT